MSAEQLHRPVLAGEIAAARAAVETAAAVPPGTLDRFELSEGVAELAALESQVVALRLALVAEADERQVAEQTGDTGTDAWAAKLTGSTRGVAAGGLWLARLLQERYAATREAFAAGGINEAQVRVIVRAAEKMPDRVTDEQRAAAEEALVAQAVEGMDARRLRHAARRMLHVVSEELADEQEADLLGEEERQAENETWLTLHDNGDGTFSGRFIIPELAGNLLRTALERLSAPRRWSRNAAGERVEDPTLPGEGPSLNYTERLGAAFVELVEHLPTEGHGGVGPTVMVHLAYDNLLDGLASARLDTGVAVSAGQARRLACNAGIVPAVLGGDSEVLDQGRKKRLHTPAQRRALSLRYDSCAAEGCERPFAWCEIHHPHAWSKGGHTSLENAIPLCGHHHRRAHDDRYSMRILPTGEVRYRWRGRSLRAV
jgi:hypothetical protein